MSGKNSTEKQGLLAKWWSKLTSCFKQAEEVQETAAKGTGATKTANEADRAAHWRSTAPPTRKVADPPPSVRPKASAGSSVSVSGEQVSR